MFKVALFTITKKWKKSKYSLMNEQNVTYMYNGILVSLKNKRNYNTCYNVNEPRGHYDKQNKPVTKGQTAIQFPLSEVPKVVRLIETESRMVIARDWEVGNGELFNGCKVSIF